MKKIYIFILAMFVFILTGCNSTKNMNSISLDELNQKMENKESFIVFFNNNNSSSLQTRLDEVLGEYQLTGYFVDTDKISMEDELKLQPKITYQNPSIVFIINGVDPSILTHITNEDTRKVEIIARLKDMNFINTKSE